MYKRNRKEITAEEVARSWAAVPCWVCGEPGEVWADGDTWCKKCAPEGAVPKHKVIKDVTGIDVRSDT